MNIQRLVELAGVKFLSHPQEINESLILKEEKLFSWIDDQRKHYSRMSVGFFDIEVFQSYDGAWRLDCSDMRISTILKLHDNATLFDAKTEATKIIKNELMNLSDKIVGSTNSVK